MQKNLLKCVLNEKNILKDIDHPYIVKLKYAFQTRTRVHLVMEFCDGGDLSVRLKKKGKFNEDTVKFYAAEIVLALEYLHEKLNIIHRDIKPENILVSSDGHVKITDFGLAKTTNKASTLCGTPAYLAPEIIWGRAYGRTVDWWSLGCLIYEMLTGCSPFGHETKDKLIQCILNESPKMLPSFSSSLTDLLQRLLAKDPRQRLGFKGAYEVKNHPFFKDVNWDSVLKGDYIPPFRAEVTKQETLLYHEGQNDLSPVDTPLPGFSSNSRTISSLEFPQFSYFSKDTLNDIGEIKK